MKVFSYFVNGLLDIIYPKKSTCLFCDSALERVNYYELCDSCMSILPYMCEYVCTICGRPLVGNCIDSICEECKDAPILFDGASSIFEFRGIVQEAIYKLKFHGSRETAIPLGRFMACKLKENGWDIDFILPVPLHMDRLTERGFNQSYLLASEIGRECDLSASDNVLIRKRATESQVYLSKLDRIGNVKGAFDININSRKIVKGRNILLVDDIMTTGATLNECSRILRQNGAKHIYCLTSACPAYDK